MEVAIIITILDGDDRTAGCLAECQKQMDAIAVEGRYSFSIFLNNEGQEGYQAVWEKASKDGYDFYLWVGYDLRLAEGALACFLENSEFLRHKAVITGTVAGPDRGLLFGGRSRHGRLLEPDKTIPVPCHLYDMALALVPSYAFSRLENPADFFRQSLFDYGYGAKVAKAGVARVIAPGILAQTTRKPEIPVWKNPDNPAMDRARSLLRSIGREIIRILHTVFR